MKKITEQVKPVIAREPGKKNGAIGGVLIGPDGKPIKGSWKKISDLPVGQRPPQANIDNFLKIEREKANQQPRRPSVPGLPPSAAQPGQGPKGNEVGSKPPAPPAGDSGGTRRPPAPVRQPAQQASPVAAYVKAAAAARKSGDPTEMAKVRDMGMEIWRKANPKLAAAADERARIRGTAQTDNPLMKDMRDRLPLTPSVQSPTLKKDLGLGQQSLTQNPNTAIAATPKPAPVTRASVPLQNPTVSEPLPKATAKPEEKSVKKPVNSSYEYDAYDLVLEYLISQGHADTISEANYIMLHMSADHIQDIVESPGEWFRGIFNSNNSAASRAQNTSPFNRQTQPLPSTTSPFAKPASYTDSGKLTPYGAGGGAAAEKEGKTRAEVMRQGANNLENKKRPGAPDPNFGR